MYNWSPRVVLDRDHGVQSLSWGFKKKKERFSLEAVTIIEAEMRWITNLIHKFKLSQIKTPGSCGLYFYIGFVIINFKIHVEFLSTRNGNVVVIVIGISNGDSV